MNERPQYLPYRANRLEVLVQEIMKALHMDHSEARAMATEMVIWELIFAARTAGVIPPAAESVA
jgi:hypothetical protein